MSLVAWYPLTKDTNDYSGNNLHLTNNGAVLDPEGKIGKCYDCQGDANKYMSVTSSLLADTFNSNEFTFCAWFSANGFLASMGVGGIRTQIHMGLRNLNSVTFAFYADDLDVMKSFVANKFYHYTAVYKNRKQYLYIDGKLIGSRTTQGNLSINNSHPFILGKYYNSNSKKLNDVRIYNHALTANEIYEISKAKIAHYTFNEKVEEATKNLYANYPIPWGINNEDNNIIKSSFEKLEKGHYRVRLEKKIDSNCWPNVQFPVYDFIPGKIYTISIDIKTNIKQNQANAQLRHSAVGNDYWTEGLKTISFTGNVNKGWQRYVLTRTINAKYTQNSQQVNASPRIELYTNMHKVGDLLEFEFKNYQVEEKDHATPFTPNERTNTILDISDYKNNIDSTYVNEPVWKEDDKLKGCYDFNGSSNFFKLSKDLKVTDEITINVWVYMDDWTKYNSRIISCTEDGRWNFKPNAGNLSFVLHNGDTYTANFFASLSSLSSGWHMFTATYSKDCSKTYVDGIFKNKTVSNNKKISYNSANTIFIGAEATTSDIMPSGNYFNGKIADTRIYATALSDKDIKLLYNPETNIDKNNIIRCSEINEYIFDDKYGFKKDASVNYKEFNEVQEIKSGIHNLKLGEETLPVLVGIDNDGGRWARVFYHNCKGGTVLFNNTNNWAEAKETNKTTPTTSDKYSILSKLDCFRYNTKFPLEFRLRYPTDEPNKSNVWKQTSNPTYQKVTGYKAIKIDWTDNRWGGLEYNGTQCLADGSVNHGNWFYAIGGKDKHQEGIPSYAATVNDVELWVRISNYDLFVDNNISNVSISKDNIITAKEFNEIDI